MRVGGSAAAEEADGSFFGGCDLVPGAWGNQDGIAGIDGLSDAIDFHFGGSFEDEVEFFADAMVVAFGGAVGGEGGLGKGLVLDGGVGQVEEASDRGAVFGGKWWLLGKSADDHGIREDEGSYW